MDNVVLFSKRDDFCQRAIAIARTIFGEHLYSFTGKVGDPLPEAIEALQPRFVLSFLSPWILPKFIINAAPIALNWHPASVEYPGIGCYNFALYDDVAEYGATCHFMEEKVDTGAIVEERRFPVFPSDTVETLKLRTMVTMLSMFHDRICELARGVVPKPCGLGWARRPYTRRELNALTVIDPAAMTPSEVQKRIRATVYPGFPGPCVVIGGNRFVLPVPDRKPLA